MLITPHAPSPSVPGPVRRHEFAYPRVQQIAPRAHAVLVSSLYASRGPARLPARVG